MLEDEHRELAADLGPAEREVLGAAEPPEPVVRRRIVSGRHARRRPARRLRPAAVRVGEHVEVRERQGLDQRLGRLEVGVGLPREPRDDVGAEAEIGDGPREPLDEGAVHRDRVRPPHRPEHPVRAGLERHVQVAADPALADEQLDQLLGEVGRQHGGQAEPGQPADVEEPAHQGGERRPGARGPSRSGRGPRR